MTENNFMFLLGDAMKRGAFAACKRRLENTGISKEAAEIACAKHLTGKEDEKRASQMSMEECIKSRLAKIKATHPDISTEEQMKMAKQRCEGRALDETQKLNNDFLLLFVDEESTKDSEDAISPVEMMGIVGGRLLKGRASPVVNMPIKHLNGMLKLIKAKTGLKVGHAGIIPFLMSLPMKNLNLLQTKLEKLITAEEQNLTSEELEKRSQYAKMMKKQDSMWVEDLIFIDKANTSLNNIIKAPIILAREMTQEYKFEHADGSITTEIHYKPYSELQAAVDRCPKEIPMLIEHHDSWEDDQIIGYVKDIVADDKLRAIRGMGYFNISKCPEVLLLRLKLLEQIGVSIGFMANLGDGGVFDGILYDHTQIDIELEHLAILLKDNGRCPLDQCGVNTKTDVDAVEIPKFTIINKDSYYINIGQFLESEETRKGKSLKNIKKVIEMDDNFVDPKSGKINGEEPKDLQTMLTRLRKFMAGNLELETRDFANKKIKEILHMTDKDKSTLKGDDNMDQKEFDSAIAVKDTKIDELTVFVKDALISEIKKFTTDEQQKKFKLEDQCVTKLKTIRDIVVSYDISDEEPTVIPITPKVDVTNDDDDADKPKVKAKKYDVKELNAKINEEFDLTGLEWIE